MLRVDSKGLCTSSESLQASLSRVSCQSKFSKNNDLRPLKLASQDSFPTRSCSTSIAYKIFKFILQPKRDPHNFPIRTIFPTPRFNHVTNNLGPPGNNEGIEDCSAHFLRHATIQTIRTVHTQSMTAEPPHLCETDFSAQKLLEAPPEARPSANRKSTPIKVSWDPESIWKTNTIYTLAAAS